MIEALWFHIAALAVANFVFIGLKAMQQLNVVHGNMGSLWITGYGLAAADVYIISEVSQSGWGVLLVLAMGTAGNLGCWISIVLHRKYVNQKGKP